MKRLLWLMAGGVIVMRFLPQDLRKAIGRLPEGCKAHVEQMPDW